MLCCFDPHSPTGVPKNPFIKYRIQNSEEKYVEVHVINRLFVSKMGQVDEEEDLASRFNF